MIDPRTEQLAKNLRAEIRKKAGLAPDWDKASESMRQWYRALATRTIQGMH
jgi:hypothetical protein